jgi:hypothetical protein
MPEQQFLIWSNEHRMWWRAGHLGYTSLIRHAGRYARAEAKSICTQANIARDGMEPNEVFVLAPECIPDE